MQQKMQENLTPEEQKRMQRLLNMKNPFPNSNGIFLTEVGIDYAVTEVDTQDTSLNPKGYIHGGVFFTMADSAATMAARTDGRSYVTQDAHVNYLRNQPGGRLTARAEVVHRGRQVVLSSVKVTNEEGKLLFTGDYSLFCTGDELAEKK